MISDEAHEYQQKLAIPDSLRGELWLISPEARKVVVRWHDDLVNTERERDYLAGLIDPEMPCGHPKRYIVETTGQTAYCVKCELEATIKELWDYQNKLDEQRQKTSDLESLVGIISHIASDNKFVGDAIASYVRDIADIPGVRQPY